MFPWEYLFIFLGFVTVLGSITWMAQKPITRFYNKYFGFTMVGTQTGDELLEQQLDEFFERNKKLFDEKFKPNKSNSTDPKNSTADTELTTSPTPIGGEEKFLGIILADLTLTNEKDRRSTDSDAEDVCDFNQVFDDQLSQDDMPLDDPIKSLPLKELFKFDVKIMNDASESIETTPENLRDDSGEQSEGVIKNLNTQELGRNLKKFGMTTISEKEEEDSCQRETTMFVDEAVRAFGAEGSPEDERNDPLGPKGLKFYMDGCVIEKCVEVTQVQAGIEEKKFDGNNGPRETSGFGSSGELDIEENEYKMN